MRALLLFCALLAGCAAPPVPPASLRTADSICWSHSLHGHESQWLAEARKRLADPFIFECHGNTDWAGNWRCYPDWPLPPMPVEAVASILHQLLPRRDIVLIVCNPDHLDLHVPGVWFARESVWDRPGKRVYWRDDIDGPEDGAGFISDFEEGRPSGG